MVTRRERERRAHEERSPAAAEEAGRQLASRGFYVRPFELELRSVQDCINVQNWARNRRPTALLPRWLSELLEQGRAFQLPDWCRECGKRGTTLTTEIKRHPSGRGRSICPACAAGPTCAHCGKPATCFGSYEGHEPPGFACDVCCGHGNEDGHCERVAP